MGARIGGKKYQKVWI